MNTVCRICMSFTNNTVSLKENVNNNLKLSKYGEMYENCFSIEVADLINFELICIQCEIQLKYFYDFKAMAFETYEKLVKLVKKDETEHFPNQVQSSSSSLQNNSTNNLLYCSDYENNDEIIKSTNNLSDNDNIEIEKNYTINDENYIIIEEYLDDETSTYQTKEKSENEDEFLINSDTDNNNYENINNDGHDSTYDISDNNSKSIEFLAIELRDIAVENDKM